MKFLFALVIINVLALILLIITKSDKNIESRTEREEKILNEDEKK